MPGVTPEQWVPKSDRVVVRARFVARRIDTRGSSRARRPVSHFVVRRVGDGLAVLFPYGVVATIGLAESEENELLESLKSALEEPFAVHVVDDVAVRAARDRTEGLDEEGDLWLEELGEERLVILADVLAKSVVLDHFEQSIGRVFDRIYPLAVEMERSGQTGRRARDLVKLIGHALLVRQETVWRVEVEEKPEMVWDRSDLDRLWVRLSEAYELRERHNALGRKVDLLSQSASTLLEVLQTNRSLRVEWYIVALIVFEIALTLFEMSR
jgi:required for meiotic nuclear division protein 1